MEHGKPHWTGREKEGDEEGEEEEEEELLHDPPSLVPFFLATDHHTGETPCSYTLRDPRDRDLRGSVS